MLPPQWRPGRVAVADGWARGVVYWLRTRAGADLAGRQQALLQPVAVVNVDVTDNHEEAARVAPQVLRLCQQLEEAGGWEDAMDATLQHFERDTGRRPIYAVAYY